MKHFIAYLFGIALALFGGGVVFVERASLTTPILLAGLGAIALGLLLVIPAQFTVAVQAAAGLAKAVLDAVKGSGPGGPPSGGLPA